jgi:protein TonB
MPPAEAGSVLPCLPIAAARAGGTSRELLWGCAASKALHAAAAAALLALGGLEFFSISPPQGEASIELTAVMMPAASAEPPARFVIEPDPLPQLAERTDSPVAETSGAVAIAAPPVPAGELPPAQLSVRPTEDSGPAEPAANDSPITPARQPAEPPPFALNNPAEASEPMPESQAAPGSQVDSLPVASFQPGPVYPPELLRAGIEGTVTFRLSIAADGAVVAAVIERSSGHAALDRAAEQAVKGWRFTPARRLGVAVPIEVRKSFPFVIERLP